MIWKCGDVLMWGYEILYDLHVYWGKKNNE